MEPAVIGYIGVGFLILLLFSGLHIGVVMALVGIFGMVVISGWEAGFGLLKTVPFATFSTYDFSVIPLFILMGEFCYYGNISGDLYQAAHKIFGGLRGGLAMATIGACATFAAVSGSSLATAATMSTVALPEMRKHQYNLGFATGALAAGGTIGILIPPSVVMVVYGMVTQTSIGKLFMAGFIPGIVLALIFIAIIVILCWKNPSWGPAGEKSSTMDKIKSLKGVWIVVVLFVIVIGGIYLGVFSPTEGAAIGATGAFLFALGRRRLTWKQFSNSLLDTTKTTGMIFFIMVGAMILGYFFAVTRLPNELVSLVQGYELNKYLVLTIMVFFFLILGCIMDTLAMVLLATPIIFPLMCGTGGLGFDPVWLGIIIVILAEAGMITPPIGMNVFVIKGMAPEVGTYEIFKHVTPFIAGLLAEVVLLTALPIIVLWLPAVLV